MVIGRRLLSAIALATAFVTVSALACAQSAANPKAISKPMAADTDPRFAVATIKGSGENERGPFINMQANSLTFTHATVSDILNLAYGLQVRQIVGGPDWTSSDRYTIAAKPDLEGEPSRKQWQKMLQHLMVDRFEFQFHYEKRELPVFVLTHVKNGPRFKLSDPGGPTGLGGGPDGLRARNKTIPEILEFMGHFYVDRPVVDETGLSGAYDLELNWTPDGVTPAAADAPPSFFTAIQEQAGLKLTPTKAPVQVMVIDHIEKPSEN